MAAQSPKTKTRRLDPFKIGAIGVCGFKSLGTEQKIDLRNITILAGANSSGKSSMIQPLLLLKQTLDAPYDPGALLLNGSNVRLTSAEQLLSKFGSHKAERTFSIRFVGLSDWSIKLQFRKIERKGIDIDEIEIRHARQTYRLNSSSSHSEIAKIVSLDKPPFRSFVETLMKRKPPPQWSVDRERCFFQLALKENGRPMFGTSPPHYHGIQSLIKGLIHVPGLRGNPERTYRTTAVADAFPGTFEVYVASIISNWQDKKDSRLTTLGKNLAQLGLTWKVKAARVDDTQVELKVGRLTKAHVGGQHDLVSIADVGFGMSQVLPVVVALLVAKKGQLVYVEQPELHLHPRAQSAMADIIAQAAKRGVLVVIETHSALLLLRIQTLVATSLLDPKHVNLHWFERSEDGETRVRSGSLDDSGAFGQWPEDFGEVILKAQQDYLDAAETKLLAG